MADSGSLGGLARRYRRCIARPVFWRRSAAELIDGVPIVEAVLLGMTPISDENIGLCSASRRVSIANINVSSSTSCGGLEG